MIASLHDAVPERCRDRSLWPDELLPLIDEHGMSRVWSVGLNVLRYPPTLGVEGGDYGRLVAALNDDENEDHEGRD